MKNTAFIVALVVLCTGAAICAGHAGQEAPAPIVAPLQSNSPYVLTIADTDGFSQTLATGETETFAVETKTGDKTYTVSGDTHSEKGVTALTLRFNRKTVRVIAERFPSEQNTTFQTVISLAPNGKSVRVGGVSSTGANGGKTEYNVTASLAFAPQASL